jgi:hypothetical protein
MSLQALRKIWGVNENNFLFKSPNSGAGGSGVRRQSLFKVDFRSTKILNHY